MVPPSGQLGGGKRIFFMIYIFSSINIFLVVSVGFILYERRVNEKMESKMVEGRRH